jgi:hypothetical protein
MRLPVIPLAWLPSPLLLSVTLDSQGNTDGMLAFPGF